MKIIATILTVGVLSSACATSYNPSYSYDEVLIVNNSKELIQDVTISSSETGRSFSCGNIAPLGICSDKFPPRRYEQTPIQISWVFGGAPKQSEEFVIKVPATMVTGLPLRGVLEISPEGEISTHFDQETPLR
jgi:hypothetical protein